MSKTEDKQKAIERKAKKLYEDDSGQKWDDLHPNLRAMWLVRAEQELSRG